MGLLTASLVNSLFLFSLLTTFSIVRPSQAFPTQRTALGSFTPQITWSNCTHSTATGVQCGTISVPLDYADPNGSTVQLGMVRLLTNSSKRLGTLVYNPGGPGDEASNYMFGVEQGLPNFSPALLEAYDIVGVDPRGVGLSKAIQCDPAIYNERVSFFPKTTADFESLLNYNERLGKSCADLSGPLLYHLDTINVVKDMELVRLELDDGAKLNFLGRSYGSQIGVTYAELYPENINRMALDGIVDHTQSETTTLNDEATAYEDTLNTFFSWCNSTATCALQGQDVASIYDQIVESASKTPIAAPGCTSTGDNACRSDVTEEEIRINIQGYLLFQNATANFVGWDTLSLAILQAAQGNATLLSTPLATSSTSWQHPTLAIGCQDWLHASSHLSDLLYKQSLTAITAPHTKGATQSYWYQTACLNWPAPVTNPQRPLANTVAKAPPILLVNAQHDPSTSFVWASGIQSAVPGSVLLTRVGAGHTNYQLMGEAAMAIDRFLIEGVMPEQNTFVDS
jgi:pimeloyl-ACP methyl ester carboxylesterase